MTTHKALKRRVRARAAKTGESYTAARAQLLRRTNADAGADAVTPADVRQLTGTSDDAIIRGSGRPFAEWLELLDAWGASDRPHPEIARWLTDEHDVPGWYAQTITVGFERARGLRARHQHAAGFAVSASRTIRTDPERALRAFTDASLRARWLPDAPVRQRRTTAAGVARFDWDDPPSRLVVSIAATGADRVQVAISHERLPDAETAEGVKLAWRERLTGLKALLEAG